MKFSIIIPAYNCANTIADTIDSIKKQNFTDFEIIVVNDGSTDATIDVLQGDMENIILINKENGGSSSARNIGLMKAKGEYILFADSDDIWKENLLEIIEKKLIRGIDLLVFGIEKIVKDKVINKSNLVDKIYSRKEVVENFDDLLTFGEINSSFNKVYKKDKLIKNNILFDENLTLGEDFHFNLEYILKADNIQYISDILYEYHVDNSTLTKKYIKNFYNERCYSLEKTKNICERNKIEYSFYDISKIKIVYSSIFNLQNKNCPYVYREKIREIKHIKRDYVEYVENSKRSYTLNWYFYILQLMLLYFTPTILYYVALILNKARYKISVKDRGISI
ncbi:glycosyltransferase family 2 protein [Ligilactobacillus sp. Marseille-Q7487]|uniref:glycosyltransferase family 2 protein n=1 Tax=Ligilactobacillus sp. Marseille-Q7487 TaxID=3022128 RepID=UPI0024A7CF2B|nr:glycosyltransferase family 2 protein [Ligilactobacillus sp. Marseille-Q7487]